jgi:CDP-glycerol glycerophosphotransferase (TagB/SpsB family)
VINLWHGSPIKNICLLDNKSPKEIPQSSYVLAESIAYKTIIADAFGVSSRHVIVHKHPRIDMLYSSKVSAIRQLNPEKIIIAWLPTYRKTFTGDPRDDGNAHKDVLSSSFDAKCLDLVLDKYNAICVVKPHPMAIFPEQLFSEAERIFMLDNADLAAENLSVYEFLSNTDLLITDLSSVYFDYRLTGKPSLLFFPDRAEYSVNRGFVRPLEDIVSDGFVEEFGEFIQVLDAMLEQMKVRNPTANQLPHPAAAKFSSEFLALIDTLKTGMGAD